MHLIFVHQDPSPTGGPEAICTLKLIHALADKGVKIDIVMRNQPDSSLARNNVRCFPVGSMGQESFAEKLRRISNLYPESGWDWAESASEKIEDLCSRSKITAIHSRATPFISHIAVWKAKKRVNVPWIAHFSDPWPPAGYSDGHRHSKLRLYWHRKIVRSAEAASFPCERVARFCKDQQWQMRANTKMPTTIILPHIAGQFHLVNPLQEKGSEKIVFLHCGGFMEQRRPDEFVIAWSSFLKRQPALRSQLKFKHVGNVSHRLSELTRDLAIEDTVEQAGSCAYSESLSHMAAANALLLIDSFKIKSSIYFPSKLSDYIGAGKPILAMSPEDGTVMDLLGKDYPLIAPPWSSHEMGKVLDLALEAILGKEIGWKQPVETLASNLSPEIVANQFIDSVKYHFRVIVP